MLLNHIMTALSFRRAVSTTPIIQGFDFDFDDRCKEALDCKEAFDYLKRVVILMTDAKKLLIASSVR